MPSSRSERPPAPIPTCALVLAGSFGGPLSGEVVARAFARGLLAGGMPASEPLALGAPPPSLAELESQLRGARAVVIAQRRLHRRTLRASPAFEIATRARQAGVPAYAVAAQNRLDAFEARMLDLQLILEASTPRALAAAGRRLARHL